MPNTVSTVNIFGHPIHPMLMPLAIALVRICSPVGVVQETYPETENAISDVAEKHEGAIGPADDTCNGGAV